MNIFCRQLVPLVFLSFFSFLPKVWSDDPASRPILKEEAIDWPARAATVKVGMTRAEVEQILPQWKPPPGSGKSYGPVTTVAEKLNGTKYMVTDEWRVSVIYDYTCPFKPPLALTTNTSGTISWGGRQERICGKNRVAAPVRIEKFAPLPAYDPSLHDEKLTKQISDILLECRTIKPGMTRAELMKVFTTEGGLFGSEARTYVHRRCPYIKVDVTFTLSKPPKDMFDDEERAADIITNISKPYLQWSTID